MSTPNDERAADADRARDNYEKAREWGWLPPGAQRLVDDMAILARVGAPAPARTRDDLEIELERARLRIDTLEREVATYRGARTPVAATADAEGLASVICSDGSVFDAMADYHPGGPMEPSSYTGHRWVPSKFGPIPGSPAAITAADAGWIGDRAVVLTVGELEAMEGFIQSIAEGSSLLAPLERSAFEKILRAAELLR